MNTRSTKKSVPSNRSRPSRRRVPARKGSAAKTVTTPFDHIAAYNRTAREKRPQEVDVDSLYLDPKNPRLADTAHTGRQVSIMQVMMKEFDLEPLIGSMYQFGFFWEEPLVGVREPLIELKGKKALVVIEGNRRLAALKKILHNPDLYHDEEKRERLAKVPIIIRDTRSETLAFVGFRHVTGVEPWASAAKAQYALNLVHEGLSIEEIAQTIGDKTADIERWVRTQSLVEQARGIGLSESDASRQFYFSYLLTCTSAPGTKQWLKLETDSKTGLVTSFDTQRLEQLWLWLYGSKSREQPPVISESRRIHKLNQIIASPLAVQELVKTGSLEKAHIETKDRGEYVIETLGSIRSLCQDLAGSIAGEDNAAESLGNNKFAATAKTEFARIEKALSDIKSKFGF